MTHRPSPRLFEPKDFGQEPRRRAPGAIESVGQPFAPEKRKQASRTPYAGARTEGARFRGAFGLREACFRFRERTAVRHFQSHLGFSRFPAGLSRRSPKTKPPSGL